MHSACSTRLHPTSTVTRGYGMTTPTRHSTHFPAPQRLPARHRRAAPAPHRPRCGGGPGTWSRSGTPAERGTGLVVSFFAVGTIVAPATILFTCTRHDCATPLNICCSWLCHHSHANRSGLLHQTCSENGSMLQIPTGWTSYRMPRPSPFSRGSPLLLLAALRATSGAIVPLLERCATA